MDLVMQYFPASCCFLPLRPKYNPQYSVIVNPPHKGASKSLARPGRKQATATEDFDFHISYL